MMVNNHNKKMQFNQDCAMVCAVPQSHRTECEYTA